jgi:hypothetical protein
MKENQTTKQGKTAGGAEVTSSSPLGHEEMGQNRASEQKQTGDVPADQDRKRNPAVHSLPPQNLNPKHTRQKPRTDD